MRFIDLNSYCFCWCSTAMQCDATQRTAPVFLLFQLFSFLLWALFFSLAMTGRCRPLPVAVHQNLRPRQCGWRQVTWKTAVHFIIDSLSLFYSPSPSLLLSFSLSLSFSSVRRRAWKDGTPIETIRPRKEPVVKRVRVCVCVRVWLKRNEYYGNPLENKEDTQKEISPFFPPYFIQLDLTYCSWPAKIYEAGSSSLSWRPTLK